MSERSERIIDAVPTAHGCTIPFPDVTAVHETMVHQ